MNFVIVKDCLCTVIEQLKKVTKWIEVGTNSNWKNLETETYWNMCTWLAFTMYKSTED